MPLAPVLSSLRHHRTAAALLVLEIALTCAIVCNALFVIGQRVQRMDRSSGVDEAGILSISLTPTDPDQRPEAMRVQDVAALLAVPGVRAATSINQLPYADSSWGGGISTTPEPQQSQFNASQYMDDGQLVQTLGLRVEAGRGFQPGEYLDFADMMRPQAPAAPAVALVTRAFAERAWPGQSPLGKDFYMGSEAPIRVVGVVSPLLNLDAGVSQADQYLSYIVPVRVAQGSYALRTDPARRDEVLTAAVKALQQAGPGRLIDTQHTLQAMRHTAQGRDRAVVWLLLAVTMALLAVTALGIVGMSSFWVAQRTRQIGIRRALGARRSDILRHFQLENFVLVSLGIVLGMGLAYAANLWLMRLYSMDRLPLLYLPVGALALWLLGQLAVVWPARRAAAVPPAVATRSA